MKHIVPVYNCAPLLQNKESGQNPAHYATLNTVKQFFFSQNLDWIEHKMCMNNQVSNTGSGESLVL